MKRFRRLASASIALAVVMALLMPAAAYASLTFTGGALLIDMGYSYLAPDIDGRYVVTTRYNDTTESEDVYLYNRQTHAAGLYTPSDGNDQLLPAVSGDRLVWVDYTEADAEIYYDDMGDAAPPRRLTTNAYTDYNPHIDGNWVVWRAASAPDRIGWYNIEADQTGFITPDIATVNPLGINVDRGRVVYWDVKEAGTRGVYVYDLESGGEYRVTTVSTATSLLGDTAIHGDNVAWAQWTLADPDNKNVYVEDIRTGETGPVTTNIHTQRYPSLFGDLLAWQDNRDGTEDIVGWWRPEAGYQTINTAAGDQLYPDVYGHSVVYQWGEAGTGADIFLSSADLAAARLSGTNRYETSAAISKHRFPESNIAVLATGASFADALAASSLAGAELCPLLLTEQAGLPAPIAAELDRLGVLGVFVVGGTSAVGEGVVDDLEDMGINVTRVSGANRYATARQVANYLIDIMGNENRHWRGEAFFCRGDDFADALAVAPHAYALGMPILLVQTNSVPADTAAAITSLSIDDGYVIGGTGAISAATQTALNGLCGNATERWYGANRYETAAYCAWKGWDKGWLDWDAIGVATGTNFPDALSGGAASGYYGSPIVLTAPTAVPSAVHSFFTAHRYDFGGMDVYGGTGAVNAATFNQLQGYLD
jgi:putative cell wall-binding protein